MIKLEKKWFLFVPVFALYLAGMFINVMEIDAAQYAAMSLEMLDTHHFLEIYYRGENYIDKPPLLFWTAALSFKLFGVSNFTYKLPSVLFTLLGLFSTYRLGKLVYNERAGFYAALTLASCQAWFLINHDVRTDTILAACTVLAIWQLAEFNHTKRNIHILLAAFGIAGAMLTKGPIGFMVPALAFASDFILKRKWSMFFLWQWILLIVLVFILLLPMLYGLYTQYDMSNGGKQTYNGVITSGLRFYFWTQSFGRLTGDSTWSNDTDPFFFVHTFLWSFLPWSVFFILAFWKKIKEIWTNRFYLSGAQEAITFGGILFPFIAFSLSRYKLPHYIYVFFPLVAILTGAQLDRMINNSSLNNGRALQIIQAILSFLLVSLALILAFFCFGLTNIFTISAGIAGVLLTIFFVFFGSTLVQRLVVPSFVAILTVNLLLNLFIYPNLLMYQSESVASQFVKSSPTSTLIGFKTRSYSLDFYYQKPVPLFIDLDELRNAYRDQTIWVFTDEGGYEMLRQSTFTIQDQRVLDNFHVTTLTPEFLNPSSRPRTVSHNYILRIKVL